jgi:ABC-type amino acid transport substrate-binding protein
MKKLAPLFAITLTLLAAASADAQEPMMSPADCQLRMATGKKGKGFSRILRDLRAVCGAEVTLCEVETEGGLQNAIALSANEADVGIVQLDTLVSMKTSDENIANLQAVVPMHANLLHIFVRRDGYRVAGERSLATLFTRDERTVIVSKFSELKGLPVAAVGSAQLLARTLNHQFGSNLRFSDVDSDERALAMLKSGEVAAVFAMNGWPNPTVDALQRESGITLASFDLPVQGPYLLLRKNYQRIGSFNLAFLAAPSLLVTRPFKPEGARGTQVQQLRRCILDHLNTLQEGAYEPAWKEVKQPEDVYGWPRFGQSGAKSR